MSLVPTLCPSNSVQNAPPPEAPKLFPIVFVSLRIVPSALMALGSAAAGAKFVPDRFGVVRDRAGRAVGLGVGGGGGAADSFAGEGKTPAALAVEVERALYLVVRPQVGGDLVRAGRADQQVVVLQVQ